MGEARLWYEMLNTQQQQLDWAGLQECFRQQYSKFGNTREQYFHAWRSFHFDEATDTIDGYIQKVKQVAALLKYEEPQILELFKNTLPSRLYYMLYQIHDLRVAVENSKRLLNKEQMDKKSGQANSSPFMQASQGNSKSKIKAKKNEKTVSYSAVEAIERTTDSIEKLASLMNKMDTKLDRREDQYRPRMYPGRGRGCGYRQNNYMSRNRSYSSDWYQNNYRGRGNYNNRVGSRNYRSNYRIGPETETITDMAVDIITDQITEGMIVTKGMETEIRTVVGLEKGTEIGVAQENVPNPEVAINLRTELRAGE